MARKLRVLSAMLSALIPTAGLIAETDCTCRGHAQVFAVHNQFLDARVSEQLVCEGRACDLIAGKVYRIDYHKSFHRDKSSQQYLSRADGALANKRPGYQFEFFYTRSVTNGIIEASWEITP